jgi:PKD repeat protein
VVRWYELVPSKLEARQVGTISDQSKDVFNGAIAPTGGGGALVDYNTGNATNNVNVMAQSRKGLDPLGTMSAPITLASSEAIDSDFSCPSQPAGKEFTDCRWGDYAGASVDPTNSNLVWGSSQVNGPTGASSSSGHAAQWQTHNFALALASDEPPIGSFTPSAATVVAGTAVNFAASASDSDGTISDYYFDFGDHTTAHGSNPSHVYSTPGTFTVTLLVTDNAGLVNTAPIRSTIIVTPAPTGGGGSGSGGSRGGSGGAQAGSTSLIPAVGPNDNFSSLAATINQKTGTITFTELVENAGTFSWLLTFQNGKFGVFAAQNAKCKAGYMRLNGKCRPSKVLFARGTQASAPGIVSFTVKPTAAALKALKNALRRRKGLPVTATLTFQSSAGGSPVSHTQSLSVKLKK